MSDYKVISTQRSRYVLEAKDANVLELIVNSIQ